MNEEQIHYLREACLGNTAAIQIVLLYFKEEKITQADKDVIIYTVKQFSRQNHHAIYFQALLYHHGYGVKQDYDMAFLLMREAAAKGNSKAIFEVGHRFLEGIGVSKLPENALQWLSIAAESPNYIKEAMLDLAYMYEEGIGVEVDKIKAEMWHKRAAE